MIGAYDTGYGVRPGLGVRYEYSKLFQDQINLTGKINTDAVTKLKSYIVQNNP